MGYSPHGLAVVLVTLLISQVLAAEQVVLRVPDAVSRAVESSAELRQKQLAVSDAQVRLTSAWNLFLPGIDAGVSLSRSFDGRPSPWRAGLNAGASLKLSAGARTQIDLLATQYRTSLIAYEISRQQLERTVKETVYAILLNDRRRSIAGSNLTLARKQYLQVQEQYQSGRASELDLLSARLSYTRRRPEADTLEQNRNLLVSKLSELVGLTAADTVSVVGSFVLPAVPINGESMATAVIDGSVELQELELQVTVAEQNRSIVSINTRVPTLSVSFAYSPTVSPPLAGAPWQDPSTWRTGTLSFNLDVPIDPFVPHSAGDNTVRTAGMAIEKARLALDDRVRTMRIQVLSLIQRFELSKRKLDVLRAAEELASLRFRRTADVYQSGGKQLLDVENAQNDMQQAQLDVVSEMYSAMLMLTELESLTGRKLISE